MNQMWDEIQSLVDKKYATFNDRINTVASLPGHRYRLDGIIIKYSKIISDPDSVDFVTAATTQEVVEIDARLGWWAYLLKERDKTVTVYAKRKLFDAKPWLPVLRQSRKLVELRAYDQATLMLVAPASYAVAASIINQFRGPRIVLLGKLPEIESFTKATEPFNLVASHRVVSRPAEMHQIFVFERKANDGWLTPTLSLRSLAPRR